MKDIKVIKGRLCAVGYGQVNLFGGHRYGYIRFRDENGNDVMCDRVYTGKTVDSYIQAGLEGDFFLISISSEMMILVAIKTQGRMVHAIEETQKFEAGLKKDVKRNLYFFLPFGLLTIPLLVGVVIAPLALLKGFKYRKESKRIETDSVVSYLNQYDA